MESQRWRRLEALFAAATELEPGERGPWLEAQCGDDPNLLHDVRVLLDADKRASDGYSIADTIELAAQQFARDSSEQPTPPKAEERITGDDTRG